MYKVFDMPVIQKFKEKGTSKGGRNLSEQSLNSVASREPCLECLMSAGWLHLGLTSFRHRIATEKWTVLASPVFKCYLGLEGEFYERAASASSTPISFVETCQRKSKWRRVLYWVRVGTQQRPENPIPSQETWNGNNRLLYSKGLQIQRQKIIVTKEHPDVICLFRQRKKEKRTESKEKSNKETKQGTNKATKLADDEINKIGVERCTLNRSINIY